MWSRMQYFARETTISLRRNLLMTIAGILTVAVSLALFGGIMLLSQWVDHGTTQIKGGVRLEVFMAVPASTEQIDDVRSAIEDDPQIKDYRFLTKAGRVRGVQADLQEGSRPREERRRGVAAHILPDRAGGSGVHRSDQGAL